MSFLTTNSDILPDRWLTVAEAAKYAKMSERVLRRKARRREIQFGRVGRNYRFKVEHIDSFFMANGWDGRGK